MGSTQLIPARVSLNGTGHEPHSNGVAHRELRLVGAAIAEKHSDSRDGLEDHEALVIDLRRENAQLQEMLDQARDRLKQGEKASNHWKVREQEYEGLLEEKSELIRQLHAQLESVPTQEAIAAIPKRTPKEDELIALQQELEQEKEQLHQDEEALMAEMRNMEITMSRERAEMARQRSELQRLQNELKHELESASRDAAIRDKLAPLYRLQEEIIRRRPGGDSGVRPAVPVPAPAPAATVAAPPAPNSTAKKSGFFRRMFKSGS